MEDLDSAIRLGLRLNPVIHAGFDYFGQLTPPPWAPRRWTPILQLIGLRDRAHRRIHSAGDRSHLRQSISVAGDSLRSKPRLPTVCRPIQEFCRRKRTMLVCRDSIGLGCMREPSARAVCWSPTGGSVSPTVIDAASDGNYCVQVGALDVAAYLALALGLNY